MNWTEILTTLGSTAIVVAVLGFVARSVINHLLQRDLEGHRSALAKANDKERTRLENELREQTDNQLMAQQNDFDQQMELYKSKLASSSAKADRIRDEVLRWSNPILTSIGQLQGRLENILTNKGYLMLSCGAPKSVGWSASYEYFMPSTVYLFCQYFCWTELLQQKLSFEMFEKHEVKDAFFERVRAAARTLSSFPLHELEEVPGGEGDRQVFSLEQRALGEILSASRNSEIQCMGYAEFLDKWDEGSLEHRLKPLVDFVDELSPQETHRWRRLQLFSERIEDLRGECRRLLEIETNAE